MGAAQRILTLITKDMKRQQSPAIDGHEKCLKLSGACVVYLIILTRSLINIYK